MTITLIQTAPLWEDAAANRQPFSGLINSITDSTDLILLPEMFSTGFTMSPEAVAEGMDGPTVQWMRNTATEKNCAITGSVVISDGANYYNRLIFAFPAGR